MNKQELRALLRTKYRGDDARAQESQLMCRHILKSSLFRDAKVIGGYMPLRREADVLPVLTEALRQGKALALPLCEEPPVMIMRRVDSLTELHPGAYGIWEPSRSAPIVSPDEIDLLLVPLEGIDHAGWRLGKGGGYYDHLLKDTDIMTLGCAMSWQWAEDIPHDPWDRKLHACADQSGIHTFIYDYQRK